MSKYLHHSITVLLPETFIAVPTSDSRVDQSQTALLVNSTNKPFITTTDFFFFSLWLISNDICLALRKLQRIIFKSLFVYEFLLSVWKCLQVCKIASSVCSSALCLLAHGLDGFRLLDQNGQVLVKQWSDKF